MCVVRRRLRGWVTAWLVFQAVSLSALVPADCCEFHAHAAKPAAPCHETAAAMHCTMAASDGAACPMHRDNKAAHHDHGRPAPVPVDDCSMRGTCDGPDAAFMALLSHAGVLNESIALDANLNVRDLVTPLREHAVTRFAPPDSPPPRA